MANTEPSLGWTSYPVVQLEHAGLIGFFLRHDQRLEMVELQQPQPTVSSPAKRAKGASLPATNGTITTAATTVVRQYDLNGKLFAIHEPYLMKTERDSLIKMVNDKDKTPANGTATKTAANRAKKRKKAITKKVTYLEQNLADDDERILATRLIEQCLLTPPPKVTVKSPSKRKISTTTNTSTATTTTTPLGDKADLLLRNINGGANGEAQRFVENLFRNRFESLNYRSKIFCNPYSRVLRVKIGLSNYLVPPRCSFAGIDICTGIQKLTADLKAQRCHRATRDPFYVVLDPAWENNKSVKRKKTYETVSADYLRRMCRDLKELIDEVLKLREVGETKVPSVVVAVWTTRADKDFVLGEMLDTVGATVAFDLKWHKVTTSGCPVKVHGGLEYLIIAERWATPPTPVRTQRSGLLISVPSAIHSHKPSLVPVFRKLYHLEVSTNASATSRSASQSPDYSHEHGSLMNYSLAPDEVMSPLMGVELFARYLQPGFHAIGFECIKLQNEELFVEQKQN